MRGRRDFKKGSGVEPGVDEVSSPLQLIKEPVVVRGTGTAERDRNRGEVLLFKPD